MKYRLDMNGDLVAGDALTFAYSGSGVATLVDAAGTGYKIAVGTHNLAAIEGDELVLMDAEAPAIDGGAEVPGSAPVGGYEELHTKKQLLAICADRGIEVKGSPPKAVLAKLLVEWDAAHPPEAEGDDQDDQDGDATEGAAE